MHDTTKQTGPVLTHVTHGGHTPEAAIAAAVAAVGETTFETAFAYLFQGIVSDPNAHLPADQPAQVVAGLKALGVAMVEGAAAPGDELQATGNSTIPPVYTYWGQFIDHDLTANTDRNSAISDIRAADLKPLDPAFVVANLKNLRQPTLNLDSVYGDGPMFDPSKPTQAASFYDGIKLKMGTVATSADIGGVRIPPDDDLARDLPRIAKRAQIADARNDENLIIAQLHTAFLRFHNNVVDELKKNHVHGHTGAHDRQLFKRARQLTQWHYQWLVVHDFLKTVTLAGIVDKILLGGPKHYKPRGGKPFMPLEFSIAGYRFGHTMVRAAYDYNRNFGRAVPPANSLLKFAPFNLLFAFTGREGNPNPFPVPGTTDTLPFNWIIEWKNFVNKGSAVPDHFARKIDTQLAPPLKDMGNEGNSETEPAIKQLLKDLAQRNLLRGYLLSLPTGQSVAQQMSVKPLTPDELHQGNSPAMNQILDENGFVERTPLWFYVLKEAEVRANGNSLGELGSRLVCETIIGQLLNDPESYLNHKGGWDPSQGVRLPGPNQDPIVTIGDFIRFAGIPVA
jgi:Animal haem peroxidase